MRAGEAGASLIEVVAALAILGAAGAAGATLTMQALHSVESVHAAEGELVAADAFLEAVALWTRDDLDRRLGDRPQGAWRLRIDRPLPTVYRVSLRDSLGHVLLQTYLFRPELPAHEPREAITDP